MPRLISLLGGCALLAGCGVSYTDSVDVAANTSLPADSTTTTMPTADELGANLAEPQAAARPESEVSLKILTFDEIQKLIAGHKGKVVVMDCWSTSCDPCVKEFPNLVALHKKHGPEKVACISFSFDYEGLDKPEAVHPNVLKFLQEKQATFDNVMSSEDSDALYRKLELASIPAVYVYGPDGKLAKRFDNEQIKKADEAFTYQDVGRLIAELLK